QRLAAAHAEPRARRVRRLARRAHRSGDGGRRRGLLGLPPWRRPAGRYLLLATLAVRRHPLLGRGLLSGLLLGELVGLLHPHPAGHPEAGPEERAVDAGAALGHALARAEGHLALGV